jgi:hypothetical protein
MSRSNFAWQNANLTIAGDGGRSLLRPCRNRPRHRRAAEEGGPPGDIVRNVDVTTDGNVVTANSLVNQIGIVEIK